MPYEWDVQDCKLRISVSHAPLDPTVDGELSEDDNTMSGGPRPNPGADETVNMSNDMAGTRVDRRKRIRGIADVPGTSAVGAHGTLKPRPFFALADSDADTCASPRAAACPQGLYLEE